MSVEWRWNKEMTPKWGIVAADRPIYRILLLAHYD
jgi:hypothetical protein